jgi:hypothetical protein
MRVEELKNYGKGLLDLVPDTAGLRREEQIDKTVPWNCRESWIGWRIHAGPRHLT